ncbi:acyloxyacyl hydrolase [Phaeobacter sp.]|uniref:acyloxyacyl hydrolase n=1 Tax=Phaeobacter sp. TaxID=1902409 RepID=UPI0025EF516D|nr:acyloxyacyl hydrolase [Phaeobacter sp.]
MRLKTLTAIVGLGLASIISFSVPAISQELVLGAGYSEFSRPGSEDSALISAEYQHSPFWEQGRFSAAFAAAADVQTTGDLFVGVGAVGRWQLQRGWFVETSVLPGAYFENVQLNDLGSTFEIRSALAVGRSLPNGNAISLALAHKSNASTADINPGVNSLLLRYHMPLNR